MNTAKQKIVKSTLFVGLIGVSMAMPLVAGNLAHTHSVAHAATATQSTTR